MGKAWAATEPLAGTVRDGYRITNAAAWVPETAGRRMPPDRQRPGGEVIVGSGVCNWRKTNWKAGRFLNSRHTNYLSEKKQRPEREQRPSKRMRRLFLRLKVKTKLCGHSRTMNNGISGSIKLKGREKL